MFAGSKNSMYAVIDTICIHSFIRKDLNTLLQPVPQIVTVTATCPYGHKDFDIIILPQHIPKLQAGPMGELGYIIRGQCCGHYIDISRCVSMQSGSWLI